MLMCFVDLSEWGALKSIFFGWINLSRAKYFTLSMRINATLTDKTQGEKYINCLPFSIDNFIQTNSTIIYVLQLITLSLLILFVFSINME